MTTSLEVRNSPHQGWVSANREHRRRRRFKRRPLSRLARAPASAFAHEAPSLSAKAIGQPGRVQLIGNPFTALTLRDCEGWTTLAKSLRQIPRLDDRSSDRPGELLNLRLADIAWPAVGFERPQRLFREDHLPIDPIERMSDQRANVIPAFPEGRHQLPALLQIAPVKLP
jgi:hypothetical protein